MKTPLIYKLDIFILIQQIIDRQYLILSEIPFVDSISFSIEISNTVLQSEYEVIKVTNDNISDFSQASIGNYVLSWKNSDVFLKQLIESKKNQKVSIQYVNYEESEEEQEPNKEDHIDWDPDL